MEEELEFKNRKKERDRMGTGPQIETNNGIIGVENASDGVNSKIGESEILHRLSATREADNALNNIVERVNDGFKGGRITRTQALSWLLIRQVNAISESDIQEIRTEFFDEVSMLQDVLRLTKTTGKLPLELRSVLQKQLGIDLSGKRKQKN